MSLLLRRRSGFPMRGPGPQRPAMGDGDLWPLNVWLLAWSGGARPGGKEVGPQVGRLNEGSSRPSAEAMRAIHMCLSFLNLSRVHRLISVTDERTGTAGDTQPSSCWISLISVAARYSTGIASTQFTFNLLGSTLTIFCSYRMIVTPKASSSVLVLIETTLSPVILLLV